MMDDHRFLIIVSDFHLSEGWDEETKHLSRNEDFFFDTAFFRFLSKQVEIAAQGGYRLRLLIPGDLVDFLQVTTVPSGDRLDGEPIEPRHRQFGLGTSSAHTCWKLKRIMSGHRVFFDALARFLSGGHDLVILPGNHDIEWVIPEVQATFVSEMATRAPAGAEKGVAERIRFLPWFYLEPNLIYVDHGHQYDRLNSFDHFLHPYLSDGRIDLPAGSFFVRYLFNKVELSFPFADNMKPSTAFICWALKRIEGWRNIPKYLRFFNETLKKAGPIKPEWREQLEQEQAERLRALSGQTGLPVDRLSELQALWVQSAIHHAPKWRLFLAFLGAAGGDDPLTSFANRISALLDVRYVVFGHTHEADLQPLSNGPPGAEYVNSGTWTKVFAENVEERLLKEESEFVYVLIDRAGPKIELLRWRDDLGAGERVRLFQRLASRPKVSPGGQA
ncbi:MAG: hypothetical protein ACE5IQ_06480 [Candidatus Methylomirabilales bacterium]